MRSSFGRRFCFVFALIRIRTKGKRILGQLSAFDFVIIIALGSAVGDPMFYEDVPLLYGMAVVVIIIGMERVLALLTSRSRQVEKFVDSAPTIMVLHGVVDRAALRSEPLSLSELYQALRGQGVAQPATLKWPCSNRQAISVFVPSIAAIQTVISGRSKRDDQRGLETCP